MDNSPRHFYTVSGKAVPRCKAQARKAIKARIEVRHNQMRILPRVFRETILELLGSARFFYKSNLPTLFYSLFRTEKSAGKFDLQIGRADPSRFNIVSVWSASIEKRTYIVFTLQV